MTIYQFLQLQPEVESLDRANDSDIKISICISIKIKIQADQ